jgi:hypothetical protein
MGAAPVFASASEALDVARAALGYLAAADATGLTPDEQAGCLLRLERLTSVTTAARASVLGAFTFGKGYSADADYSPRAWLIHKTGITRGAAVSYTAWAKRAAAHPRVFEVLAADGGVSESFARTICLWTDKLPAASRDVADAILIGGALSGLALPDLAVLASEMLARSWQPDRPDPAGGKDRDRRPEEPRDEPGGGDPESDAAGSDDADRDRPAADGQDGPGEDPHGQPGDVGYGSGGGDGQSDADGSSDGVFEDRALKLLVTFQGAGVLHGDLTPECAEIVNTVLDALAVPAGPEDTRDKGQRYHDALQEAMTRLIASGLLPERGGQPVKAWVNVSLADLMLLDGSSALLDEWTDRMRTRFAAHRAASAGGGGDTGGAWLAGEAAQALTCDAVLAPVVTGDVDPAAFDDLIRLCVELDKLRHNHNHDHDHDGDHDHDHHGDRDRDHGDHGSGPGAGRGCVRPGSSRGCAWPGAARPGTARSGSARSRDALEQAIVGKAVALLSGPGGLASFLRRKLLGARLGGPSLPLDIGYSDTIPASIRNAVKLRDLHCQWAGGCDQPASACDVHHTRHKADGGQTSLKDCVLLCRFHHQIVIHRWGWTLIVNPDGTTTAWNKDKTKVLHSHSPPARAG